MCFSLLAELKTTPRTNYARSGEGLGKNHTAGGQTMIWRSTWSKPAFKKVSWITLRVPVLRSAVYVSSARPSGYRVISLSSKPSMLWTRALMSLRPRPPLGHVHLCMLQLYEHPSSSTTSLHIQLNQKWRGSPPMWAFCVSKSYHRTRNVYFSKPSGKKTIEDCRETRRIICPP
jgi:hypothetical protein